MRVCVCRRVAQSGPGTMSTHPRWTWTIMSAHRLTHTPQTLEWRSSCETVDRSSDWWRSDEGKCVAGCHWHACKNVSSHVCVGMRGWRRGGVTVIYVITYQMKQEGCVNQRVNTQLDNQRGCWGVSFTPHHLPRQKHSSTKFFMEEIFTRSSHTDFRRFKLALNELSAQALHASMSKHDVTAGGFKGNYFTHFRAWIYQHHPNQPWTGFFLAIFNLTIGNKSWMNFISYLTKTYKIEANFELQNSLMLLLQLEIKPVCADFGKVTSGHTVS